MRYCELPEDLQEEVSKLVARHNCTSDEACKYYLMGGFEHGDHLLTLKDAGVPEQLIVMANEKYWEEKNKGWLKQMESL